MLYHRKIGQADVYNFVELIGPTHDPEKVFPDLAQADLDANADWLAPNHIVPSMNRLVVGIQIWMLRLGDHFVVIDTGVGNAKPRGLPRFNQLNTLFPLWLKAAGVDPDGVTHVINTHLHGDHVGWNTVKNDDGANVPFFPNAQYWMPQEDADYFLPLWQADPNTPNTESLTDSVVPLMEADKVRYYGDGHEFIPGLRARPARGHTPGQHRIDLLSAGKQGIFCADVFHSPIQIVHSNVNTPFCELGDVARTTRKAFIQEVADTGTLVMPCHFGFPHCGTITSHKDGFGFQPEQRTL